ncbi:MAG: hypothetical protein Q4F35_02240 [Akkermansia sp.]|nr:hypothetical protein [Akkermansia sp.]
MFRSQKTSSRYSGRVSLIFLLWMILFGAITSGCGVTYAYFKNQQVAVKTEINKLQQEISDCRMNANQYRAKANAQTNRWAMRSRLQFDNSALREISRDQIEFARSQRDIDAIHATAAR